MKEEISMQAHTEQAIAERDMSAIEALLKEVKTNCYGLRNLGIHAECQFNVLLLAVSDREAQLSAAQKRIEALEHLLKKAHDAMHSWHSSEYANHPLSLEVSKGLYK